MNNTVYVHYGTTVYDPEKFMPISNSAGNPYKPRGGFWGSRANDPAAYTWKDWNDVEEFKECDDNNCVHFVLREGARVKLLHSIDDFRELPRTKWNIPGLDSLFGQLPYLVVDFESLSRDYDAVELFLDSGNGYCDFGGWDCDSIVVLNKDAVIQIDE